MFVSTGLHSYRAIYTHARTHTHLWPCILYPLFVRLNFVVCRQVSLTNQGMLWVKNVCGTPVWRHSWLRVERYRWVGRCCVGGWNSVRCYCLASSVLSDHQDCRNLKETFTALHNRGILLLKCLSVVVQLLRGFSNAGWPTSQRVEKRTDGSRLTDFWATPHCICARLDFRTRIRRCVCVWSSKWMGG
jgi:hypothetical protein